MGYSRLCVMPDPPLGPLEEELSRARSEEDSTSEQMADCLNGDAELWRAVQEHASATDRLLSFRLPGAGSAIDVRSRSARSLARKARAAMTRLMWRCQACQDRASQWSRPSSSLAGSKQVSIVQRSPATPPSSARVTSAGAN